MRTDGPTVLVSASDMSDTGRVVTVDLQTWASVGTLIGVGIALIAVMFTALNGLRGEIGGLRGEIGGLRGEMRDEIGGLRAEMRDEIGQLRSELVDTRHELKAEIIETRAKVSQLDQRVYELATGQTRRSLIVPPTGS